MMRYHLFKRLIDFWVALLFLVTYFPFFAFIYLLLKLEGGGSPFVAEVRLGENQKKVLLLKFRTMRISSGAPGAKVGEFTRIGRFLKQTGLDELPKIFYVLNGTLSFVGPRPLIPYEIKRYKEAQLERFNCRPGLTGYAQIYAGKDADYDQKVELDIYYVRNQSFLLDLNILAKTVVKVFELDSENKRIS